MVWIDIYRSEGWVGGGGWNGPRLPSGQCRTNTGHQSSRNPPPVPSSSDSVLDGGSSTISTCAKAKGRPRREGQERK
jgi:hypothetical protein